MSTENPIVAANAVVPDALPLDQLVLIGVMLQGESASALLRTAQGTITKVTVGDPVNQRTVAAIADDQVILVSQSGSQTVLQMPS